MSHLLSEGHADARVYPVWLVWDEALIARQRFADRVSTEAAVMQATIASVIAGGTVLSDALKELRNGE